MHLEAAQPPRSGLQQGLKQRHMTMIALGGVIGAGLFVGSGVVTSIGMGAALAAAVNVRDTPLNESVTAPSRCCRTAVPSKSTNWLAVVEGTTRTQRSPASFSYDSTPGSVAKASVSMVGRSIGTSARSIGL